MCPGELTALPQASWLDFGDVRREKGGERERKKSGRGKGRKKRGGNG